MFRWRPSGPRTVAIPSYSEVLFLQRRDKMKEIDVSKSQSLLIQRSYSYSNFCEVLYINIKGRNPFLFRGPIPTKNEKRKGFWVLVAIPSYSEVLFLRKNEKTKFYSFFLVAIPSYSEVLFLLGSKNPSAGDWVAGRNPFLFRGPIPTWGCGWYPSFQRRVAIPSYSEVLFLPRALITPLFST